jgi:hypothetical protein
MPILITLHRLEQRIATRLELYLSFVDAIITEVKMSIARTATLFHIPSLIITC